jgi:hypothetical protein
MKFVKIYKRALTNIFLRIFSRKYGLKFYTTHMLFQVQIMDCLGIYIDDSVGLFNLMFAGFKVLFIS